jgi:hypothetical protein
VCLAPYPSPLQSWATGERCALWAGWPWRLPARAPSDPYVLALEHTVPQPTVSPPPVGPRGYPSESLGHAVEPRCVRHVSLGRACRLTPRFPPRGPPGRVPPLRRYYQDATTHYRPSRRTSLPSFGSTPASTRSLRSPADECAAGARSGHPVSPAGISPRRRQGLPGSWGTPTVRSPCSVDAGGTADTRPVRYRGAAPGITKARAPATGLSALNSMAFGLAVHASRCGLPTPRAGLASSRWSGSTGRASHPQGSDERFRRVYDISSSSPKLA